MKSNIIFLFIFPVICCSFVQAWNPSTYAEKTKYESDGHVVVIYETPDPNIEYIVQDGEPVGYRHLIGGLIMRSLDVPGPYCFHHYENCRARYKQGHVKLADLTPARERLIPVRERKFAERKFSLYWLMSC
jgi:hypothetical protein